MTCSSVVTCHDMMAAGALQLSGQLSCTQPTVRDQWGMAIPSCLPDTVLESLHKLSWQSGAQSRPQLTWAAHTIPQSKGRNTSDRTGRKQHLHCPKQLQAISAFCNEGVHAAGAGAQAQHAKRQPLLAAGSYMESPAGRMRSTCGV